MKKLFLFTWAIILASAISAQGYINLTFQRNGEEAEVIVSDAQDNPMSGVTATIEATSPSPQSGVTSSGVWNAGGTMGSSTNILTVSTNTSGATEAAPITYTITISGLNGFVGCKAKLTHKAVNMGGNLQSDAYASTRHCNIKLEANDTEISSLQDHDIWKTQENNNFEMAAPDGFTANESNVLTLKLSIWKGSSNDGCFYGLEKITLVSVAEPGKYYSIRITPTLSSSDSRTGAIITSTYNDSPSYSWRSTSQNTADEIFTFEDHNGKLYMKNVHTGAYISDFGTSNISQFQVQAKAEEYTAGKSIALKKLGTTTINDDEKIVLIGITPEGGAMLNCHNDNKIVSYNNTNADKASSWYLQEEATFKQTLTVGSAGWSTLMLGYNATIPDGAKCYIVQEMKNEYAMLQEISEILPANTPVIIEAEQNPYEFLYTDEECDAIDDNMLEGTLFTKNINIKSYVLAVGSDGTVGLHIASLNQDNGTAFKNNANKAYMPKPTGNSSAVLRFGFQGTTDINNIETAPKQENEIVYDLCGRPVKHAEKGIYIIRGKKVIIK